VHKDGALAGYRWGVARKAVLLDTETHRESRDAAEATHPTADMDHAA
jgi:AraC family transcriptional regulator of adaptative response/methylated-DNA-[protein]-cysteine methyltransferase